MTGFSDCAHLVKFAYCEGDNGREVAKGSRRRVFVNPFTVSAEAFDVATAEGFRTRCVLQMRACDYEGEDTIEYHAETLTITDAQPTGRGEMVRLTCAEKVADDA